VFISGAHDHRIHYPHLGMKHADSVCLGIVRAETVGTDKLGEVVGVVRVGFPNRPHLMKHDTNAALRDLKGRLTASQSAANDMNNRSAAVS
jgi:hypothetical protein